MKIDDDQISAMVGERARMARESRRMTVRDLSRQSGLSELIIAYVEGGEESWQTCSTMVRLCDALGVSLDTLIDWQRV